MLSALHSEIQRRQKVLPNQIVKPQHKNNNKENVRNNCCPITKEIKIQRKIEREREKKAQSNMRRNIKLIVFVSIIWMFVMVYYFQSSTEKVSQVCSKIDLYI